MTRPRAGRRPAPSRSAPSTTRRSRAPRPTRSPAKATLTVRNTTLTARAVILAMAVVSVAVAVALPLKIWLGQRHDISSLSAQISQAQKHVDQLNAQHHRWNNPRYVESQARRRLHYSLPGQKSYIVLGNATRGPHAAPAHHHAAVATGPWYSTLWQSVQTAGAATQQRK